MIDREDLFIDYARKKAAEEGLQICFIEGDALNLPFPDASFDVVTSHTFLTSISNQSPQRVYEGAFAGQYPAVLRAAGFERDFGLSHRQA